MHYDVKLTIEYDYQGSSDHARNVLRLLPVDIPGQQRISTSLLSLDPPPDERRDQRDFFGNASTFVAYHEPIEEVRLSLNATVERMTPPPVLELSPPLERLAAELGAERSLGGTSPHHFAVSSPRIDGSAEIEAFARARVHPGITALEAVRALGAALHEVMSFDPSATEVRTPASEAFAARRGVCQDFSHIMIAGLRALGIPAGYVSGFLRTLPPEGEPRLEGADAMHAWVRAWCGAQTGWVEFDPTNDIAVGQDHITVASGRDYGDVAPVKGMIRTAGGQKSRQSVDVIPR